MKTIIHNGRLLDGLGHEPVRADVLIRDGFIEAIGTFPETEADERIDAAGMLVTPGFIDIHRHPDLAVFTDEFGEGELAQGLTTVVGGNCGLSPVPMRKETSAESRSFLSPCLGTAETPDFDSLESYLKDLDQRALPVNMGMLAAAGAIKIWAKGFGEGPFSRNEMANAQSMLRDMMQAGALGVSLGIMYAPECYTSTAEYAEWLRAAAPFGRPICCHIRGEGDSLVASVQEVIGIGKAVGLPVHISHFKATGIQNWNRLIGEAIDRIEKARAKGQDVTVDFYPYTAGASTLSSLIPPEMQRMGLRALSAAADRKETRESMKKALYGPTPGWDNMVRAIGWNRILLTGGEGAEEWAGLDFETIAKRMGEEDPCDAMCAILAVTGGQAGVVLQSMSEEDVKRIAALPYSFLISDALYGGGAAHPRQKGAFPNFLKHFVPEVVQLPEAIRKMTSMPADRLELRDRGRLQAGCRADVAIFSPEAFTDRATFESPHLPAAGLHWLLLNGKIAWEAGKAIFGYGRTIRAVPVI